MTITIGGGGNKMKETRYGKIIIKKEVIEQITGISIIQENIEKTGGKLGDKIKNILGIEEIRRGVQVKTFNGEYGYNETTVECSIIVKYSDYIPEIARKIQERIKTNIENMTGIEITNVNVNVVGINLE